MKKATLGIVVVIAIIVLIVLGRTSKDDKGSDRVIKIGLVAPLTGNVAFLGDGLKNAVTMAQNELNSRKDAKYTYEVDIEDNAFDVNKTASAINKLLSVDHVSAFVTLASAAGNVAVPIAEQNKVVHFGIASDPNVAKGYFNFIHWTPPYEESKVFVPELVKRGFRKVAILGANIQGVIAVNDAVKKDIQGTPAKIVSEQIFEFGTKDFRTFIAKAEQAKPDVYMLEAFSPELELVTKQLKDMGIKTPITAIESFEQSDHPEIYEGDWYVNAADATSSFNDAYSKLYGKAPSLGAANAYDIIHLIATAAEKSDVSGVPTSKDIADSLYTIKDVQGALGNLSIDQDGFVASHAVVRTIKNGKPITISN